MNYEKMFVLIRGLAPDEIASHAEDHVDCPGGHAYAGYPCFEEGRPVCSPRFTAAIKHLSAVGAEAIRAEMLKSPVLVAGDAPRPEEPETDPWAEADGRA